MCSPCQRLPAQEIRLLLALCEFVGLSTVHPHCLEPSSVLDAFRRTCRWNVCRAARGTVLLRSSDCTTRASLHEGLDWPRIAPGTGRREHRAKCILKIRRDRRDARTGWEAKAAKILEGQGPRRVSRDALERLMQEAFDVRPRALTPTNGAPTPCSALRPFLQGCTLPYALVSMGGRWLSVR